jgi:hypothetical protein
LMELLIGENVEADRASNLRALVTQSRLACTIPCSRHSLEPFHSQFFGEQRRESSIFLTDIKDRFRDRKVEKIVLWSEPAKSFGSSRL